MEKLCLVLVDLQNDYFAGGLYPLEGSEAAVKKAALVLDACREAGIPVIHVRHENLQPGKKFFFPDTPGAEIHSSVTPISGEKVIIKHLVSSYRLTRLGRELKKHASDTVIVAGMQTNVCAGSLVRESKQKGFRVVLIRDALAAVSLRVHEETLRELEQVADLVTDAGNFVGSLGVLRANRGSMSRET